MSKKKTDQTLQKCDELIGRLHELRKALGDVNQVASARKPVNALGAGWSQDPGTGAFHHSTHGVISTIKSPDGAYEIRHGGGVVGRVGDISQAGAMIRDYVGNLQPSTTGMHNRPSPQLPPPTKMGKPAHMQKSVGIQRGGKQYTPEQEAAIAEARRLKKTAETTPWMSHNSVPNADEEVLKLAKTNPAVPAQHLMASQLANMMAGKKMFNQPLVGRVPLLGIEPPPQPTNEQLFGHLVPTEEQIAKAEEGWGNTFNSFLQQVTAPIGSRFASAEEEAAYWDSIKVPGAGRNGGDDYGF